MAGGCYEAAFTLIVDHLAELNAAGHRQAIARWLLALPDEFVGEDLRRTVDHCAALLFVVRPEWMEWWRRADALVGDDRPELRSRVDLLGSLRWAGQGCLERFEAQVTVARAHRPSGTSEPWDEMIDAWRARVLALHGDVDRALEVARDLYQRHRVLFRELPAHGLLASLLHVAGEPGGEALVLDSISAWRAQGEPDVTGMADVLTAGSAIALARGDLEEAELLAAGAVDITSERPTHLLGVNAEVALAEVEAALGRRHAATARLADLRVRMEVSAADPALLAVIDRARSGIGSVDGAPVDAPTHTASPVEHLTERELMILRHLASHRSFPEIGRELFISRHTVKTHVSRVYRKLGVTGRSDAVRAAIRLGLLPERGHAADTVLAATGSGGR